MLLNYLYLEASLVSHEEHLKESVNLISREFCVKALPYPLTAALQVEQEKLMSREGRSRARTLSLKPDFILIRRYVQDNQGFIVERPCLYKTTLSPTRYVLSNTK